MQLKVGSLFCGAGGFDLGFIQAGHKILWAIDSDIECCETYRKNIGNQVICKNINDINFDKLQEIDIIIGGFPCQGFSVANLNRTGSDERNYLYKFFIKALEIKKPDLFLAENVRGILSLDGGEVIKKIISDFSELGYEVECKLINAADYGVPQTRKRVFIVGTKKESRLEFDWPTPTNLNNWISVKEALKEIPEPDAVHNLKNHIGSKNKIRFTDFTSHRATNPNKPSPTILTPTWGAMPHPSNKRRMTIREHALIQTFPLDFEFYGKTMGSLYKQVGNAVPVKLAFELAKGFKKRKDDIKKGYLF